MPATTEQHFRTIAPTFMRMLLNDFTELDVLDAAAVFGNAGHESKGLTDDQEDKPTVKGSRGGRNWMQWTGPRRRSFETYCTRNKLDPDSDIAAYKWLFLELKGTEKKAIAALVGADGLEAKVIAFEKAFLRAGIKHYPARQQWAAVALDAYNDEYVDEAAWAEPSDANEPVVEPLPIPSAPTSTPPKPARSAPGWLPVALIVVLAVLVGIATWAAQHFGVATGDAAPLFGDAPVPRPRPFGLMGGQATWSDIGMQIALAFVAPLISAAATAAVGWITYLWQKILKADFDAKSADALHLALERGMMAAFEAFGAKAPKTKLLDFSANYAASKNPGSVKHFSLGIADLKQLAVPHLVSVKALAS